MSKIRNTPHVYTRSIKHLGIQWYPGNAEGFHSPVKQLPPNWGKPSPSASQP